MTLSEYLYVNISEYLDKCEQVWWTDVEDETCDDVVQIYMHEETGNVHSQYSV